MSLWRRECNLATLPNDEVSLSAALADNLAAQAELERHALQLRAEEKELRARVCALQVALPMARPPAALEAPAPAPPDAAAVCVSCGVSGKGHFSSAQRKKPASSRRCKSCVNSSTEPADGKSCVAASNEQADASFEPSVDAAKAKPVDAAACASSTTATTATSATADVDERREARRREIAAVVAAAKQFDARDPRGLASWRSLALGGSTTAEGASALVELFDGALPPNARAVLASNGELVAEMPEWIQWCVSCARLVRAYDESAGRTVRFVLRRTAASTAATATATGVAAPREGSPGSFGVGDLLIDVLGPPLVASAALLGSGDGGAQPPSGPVPLLPVRYLHARQYGAALRAQAEACARATPGTCAALDASVEAGSGGGDYGGGGGVGESGGGGGWCHWMRAQGDDEIAVALSGLREHTRLLSPAFRAHFAAQSAWHTAEGEDDDMSADGPGDHEPAGFRCSFLVPPVPPQAPRSTRL